jgi:hypothetical protein
MERRACACPWASEVVYMELVPCELEDHGIYGFNSKRTILREEESAKLLGN